MRLVALALALVPLLVACTGGGSVGPPVPSEERGVVESEGAVGFPEGRYSDREVVDALDLEDSGSGYYFLPDSECEGLLLNGEGTVALYADAGDVVATNPARTVGFKVSGSDQRECHAAFTEALADL